jgi:hypothetical protein
MNQYKDTCWEKCNHIFLSKKYCFLFWRNETRTSSDVEEILITIRQAWWSHPCISFYETCRTKKYSNNRLHCIHEHGQKLWGVPFLKKLRGGVIKKSLICDNLRAHQNQLQDLTKNRKKIWKKFKILKKSLKFCYFPLKFCHFLGRGYLKYYSREQDWVYSTLSYVKKSHV